jgi:cysteine synthase A
MKTCQSFSELIGNTPLLRLARLDTERQVFAKCEFMNPYSIKDRPVRGIIEDAEKKGKLKPGSTLIEATSGNTGIAVAAMATVRGYRAILVMSEIQSQERRQVLRALGAELILTPAAEGTAGARRKLMEIREDNPDYFYVGQHVNLSNPHAHYTTTGPEIWADTDGRVDILVAGLGTGGTLCGAGRFLKEKKPEVELIAVEPEESPYISQGIFKPHQIMGLASGFVPETIDRDLIDEFVLVSEQQAFEACRDLAKREGLLVGISSGAVARAALRVALRPGNRDKIIVGVFPDTGQRYLSVEGLFE